MADTAPLSTHRANTLSVGQYSKKGCRAELPLPADRRVPPPVFVQVIAKEVEHVQPHAAVFHQFWVGGDVPEVSRDQQLEKHHGVDRGVAGPAIELLRFLVKKTRVERFEEPSVNVFLWDPVHQPEADEEFFGKVLFALHTFK